MLKFSLHLGEQPIKAKTNMRICTDSNNLSIFLLAASQSFLVFIIVNRQDSDESVHLRIHSKFTFSRHERKFTCKSKMDKMSLRICAG